MSERICVMRRLHDCSGVTKHDPEAERVSEEIMRQPMAASNQSYRHANCGKSDSALAAVDGRALLAGHGADRPRRSFTASAVTCGIGERPVGAEHDLARAAPRHPGSPRSLGGRRQRVVVPEPPQQRRRPASCESCFSRLSIIGDTESRHEIRHQARRRAPGRSGCAG